MGYGLRFDTVAHARSPAQTIIRILRVAANDLGVFVCFRYRVCHVWWWCLAVRCALRVYATATGCNERGWRPVLCEFQFP